jgi:Type I restriction modification DNA specificity domain
LMDSWAEAMQDDCYLIAADGWKVGAQPREIRQVRDKNNKLVWPEPHDYLKGKRRFKSDLIPAPILVAKYFTAEQDAIESIEGELTIVEQRLDETREEQSGEEGLLTEVVEGEGEKQKIAAKAVKARLKEIGVDPNFADERKALEEYAALLDEQAKTKVRLKAAQEDLDAKLDAKYPALTEDEIKRLVVDDKWLVALHAAVQGELDRVSQTLTGRIRQLAERYATPLPQLTGEVEALAARVNNHFKKLESGKSGAEDARGELMQQLLTGQTRLPGFHGEWTVKRLENSCEVITKGTTPTSIGRSFSESGVNFLKAESISESGEPLLEKVAFIDSATHKLLKRSQLKDGDLLISIAGVLGRVGRVARGILPANTNQALAIIRLGSSSELERNFLFYCLRSPMTMKQINDVNVQAAQANISLQNVRDLEVHVPPTRSEQIAIAAVLSDMDAELAALEILIAKKRALKQAMMQELLTGKTRLVAAGGSHARTTPL